MINKPNTNAAIVLPVAPVFTAAVASPLAPSALPTSTPPGPYEVVVAEALEVVTVVVEVGLEVQENAGTCVVVVGVGVASGVQTYEDVSSAPSYDSV